MAISRCRILSGDLRMIVLDIQQIYSQKGQDTCQDGGDDDTAPAGTGRPGFTVEVFLDADIFGVHDGALHMDVSDLGIATAVGYQQGLVTKDIDQAGNACTCPGQFLDRLEVEQVDAGKAGLAQPVIDVAGDLFGSKRWQDIGKGDALAQLAQ